MGALQSTLSFVVFLVVLVLVHELGHFVFAKWCGVKVLKFSIGFGPKLFGFRRGETEYQLAAIPLGGFVAMAGERPSEEEGDVDPRRTYFGAPWYQRILISFGGPLFNLLFPIFAFFFAFVGSHEAIAPTLRWVEPGFPAARAGVLAGDTVVKVGDTAVKSFDDIRMGVDKAQGRPISLTVRRGSETKTIVVDPSSSPSAKGRAPRTLLGVSASGRPAIVGVAPGSKAYEAGLRTFDRVLKVNGVAIHEQTDLMKALAQATSPVEIAALRLVPHAVGGATVNQPMFVGARVEADGPVNYSALGFSPGDVFVAEVIPNSAAAKAGLIRGDTLLAIDGNELTSWSDFLVRLNALDRQPFELTWRSAGEVKRARVAEEIIPTFDEFKNRTEAPELGVRPASAYLSARDPLGLVLEPMKVTVTLSPAEALTQALKVLPETIRQIAQVIGRLFTRDVPLESVGGPILLFQVAARSAEAGVDAFLRTMALVSVNLALVNLLPIPVLDGFAILSAAWEGVRRRPIPTRAREVANIIGLSLLALLIVLVFKNDITKLIR